MQIKVKVPLLLIFVTGCLMFHQNDYKVKLDRVILLWYDPAVFGNPKVYFFRYNRSVESKLLNGSAILKIDLPNKIMFHAQVYKFASMEYRLFPINFSMDVCKVVEQDTFGTNNIWAHTNRKCCCPLRKGPFVLSNYLLDQSKLPPHVPRGMFKVDVTLSLFDNRKISNFSIYYEIETIIRWQK